MKMTLRNKRISQRAMVWLCVAALLISLMPLYAISFYNHACYDDFGYSLLTRAAWQQSGSFVETLRAALENTIGVRNTWEGNYSATFLFTLQPAVFGEGNYWLTTVVLLTFFLASLWFFMRQALVKGLHADGTSFWMAYAAVGFVLVQFAPDLSEGFFWFNGGVAYTFLWSVMLLRLGVWLQFDRSRSLGAAIGLGLLMAVLTIVVGGAKFSTLLFACLMDGLLTVLAFIRKHPKKWAELGFALLLIACLIFCATAPGNAVRAETLHSSVSAPKAVLQAFYFGCALMGSWFSLPLLVVWALVAWQLAEALRGSPLRFNHPVWITILSVCLFCAQLAPTLYTGNYLGDGRTVNTYFFTFVLMSCALLLYWVGWGLRRVEERPRFAAIGTQRRDGLRIGAFAVAVVLMVIGCCAFQPKDASTYGVQNVAAVSALRSLLSGEAARYDEAMDARDAAMNDESQPEVALSPITEVPAAFMGDALESDNVDYVLSLYAEYYQKQRVTIAPEEE